LHDPYFAFFVYQGSLINQFHGKQASSLDGGDR
jgi:hypothetical protein